MLLPSLQIWLKSIKSTCTTASTKAGFLVDERNENSIIPLINEDIYAELRKENVIHSGMIPKLDNAFEALQKGVHHVWIGKAENLILSTKGKLSGTIIEKTSLRFILKFMKYNEEIVSDCIDLLKELIATPSISKQEEETATILSRFLIQNGADINRFGNNIVVYQENYDPQKPDIWLNSHHDTVYPNNGYTRKPFSPDIEDGKLYGLGSNDAGGCLVSLLATFLHLWKEELPFNLVFIASAEEEISGKKGMELVVKNLKPADLAIVGEPTQMKMALAEKGLVVIDAEVTGKPGHAARDEGVNAIYLAMEDILKIRDFKFKKAISILRKNQSFCHNYFRRKTT